MANRRQRRLMQEALDEQLEQEGQRELRQALNQDARSAYEFDRLKRVDDMMRTAPMERAPQSMAQAIMERLAENLSPQRLSRISGLALALGLSVVTLILSPLLIAMALVALGAVGSAAALVGIIRQIVGLSNFSFALVEQSMSGLQALLGAYPHVPLLLIALIPVALFFIVRLAPRRDPNDLV